MGTDYYWIDPEHKETLDLGGHVPGWMASGDKVHFRELADPEDVEGMRDLEMNYDDPKDVLAKRVRRVTRDDLERAQLERAERVAADGGDHHDQRADDILEASVDPWRGAVHWFEARDRTCVYRATHCARPEPRIFYAEATEFDAGLRRRWTSDGDPVPGCRVTIVKTGWTLYTIYGSDRHRGTPADHRRHGFQVSRYAGDPIHESLDKLDDPDLNVPDDFDDILTREGP